MEVQDQRNGPFCFDRFCQITLPKRPHSSQAQQGLGAAFSSLQPQDEKPSPTLPPAAHIGKCSPPILRAGLLPEPPRVPGIPCMEEWAMERNHSFLEKQRGLGCFGCLVRCFTHRILQSDQLFILLVLPSPSSVSLTKDFTSLSLSFPTCKMSIIMTTF